MFRVKNHKSYYTEKNVFLHLFNCEKHSKSKINVYSKVHSKCIMKYYESAYICYMVSILSDVDPLSKITATYSAINKW